MILQGFIDLHTHGIGRYDTRSADPRDILRMANLYGKSGTSAFLPTIYSGPPDEMRKSMEAVRKAIIVQQSAVSAQPSAFNRTHAALTMNQSSLILGVHLEGPFLNPVRAGALDGGSFIKPSISSLKRLISGYEDIIRIITIAPETPGALKVIERCVAAGIRVNMGHSDATCRQAEDGKRAGATGVTHLFNAMRPFHHREPGIAGFGLLDRDIYVEVIADGAHLHRDTLKLIFSVKRRDRIIVVSDSVRGAKRGGNPAYIEKGILAGSGWTMAGSLGVLKAIGLSTEDILDVGMRNPGRLLTKKSSSCNIGLPLTPPVRSEDKKVIR